MNKLFCVVFISLCVAVIVSGKNTRKRSIQHSEIEEMIEYLERIDEMPRCGGGSTGNPALDKYYATIKYALMELKGKGTTTTARSTNDNQD